MEIEELWSQRHVSNKTLLTESATVQLSPQVKRLICCAFDVAATHPYGPGLKLHMRNALGYGATPQGIMEVLEIATALSLHTANIALSMLERAFR